MAIRRWNWKHFWRWLDTKEGSQAVCTAVGVGIATMGLLKVTANSLFSMRISELIYQLKTKDGLDEQLPEWLQKIADDENEKSIVKGGGSNAIFYMSKTTEPRARGSSWSFTANYVGLPYYFTFRTADDVRKNADRLALTLASDKLVYVDALQTDIVPTLLLSNAAKRFAIQRELQRGHSFNYFMLEPLCLVGNCVVGATLAKTLNTKLGLRASPRIVRLALYAALAAVISMSYAEQRNYCSTVTDWKLDHAAATMEPGDAEGGIEYYQQLLRKNRVLRSFLLSEGEKMFTRVGDYLPSLAPWSRAPTPLVNRLNRLKKLQEENAKIDSQEH